MLAAWCYPTVLQIGDSRSLLAMSWAANSASLIRNGQGQQACKVRLPASHLSPTGVREPLKMPWICVFV